MDNGLLLLIGAIERCFGFVAVCIGNDNNILYEYQEWRKHCLSRGFADPSRRLPCLDELPDQARSASFDPEQVVEKRLVHHHLRVSFLLLGSFERN